MEPRQDDYGLEEYYWNKHGRSEKNWLKNHLVDYCLECLKTRQFLVKTYICDNLEGLQERFDFTTFDTSQKIDMDLFVIYSLNKMKRWEDRSDIGPNMIRNVQQLHDGMNVVFLERTYLTYWHGVEIQDWHRRYKIKACHSLKDIEKTDSNYHKTTGKRKGSEIEVMSQTLSTKGSDGKNSFPDVTVAYNYFQAPKNYKQLLVKQYGESNYGYHWPRSGYWKRVEQDKWRKRALRHTDYHEALDLIYLKKYYDEDSVEEDEECSEGRTPSNFYDLSEHFIDKFVFVSNVKDFVYID